MTKMNIGFLLLIIVFVTTTYGLLFTNMDTNRLIIYSVLGFFVSFGFILGERITSIKTTLWEIQTVSQKAQGDAKKVENILLEVQEQKERINNIAKDAEEMKQMILEVADEAQDAKTSFDAFLMAFRDVQRKKRLNKFMGVE